MVLLVLLVPLVPLVPLVHVPRAGARVTRALRAGTPLGPRAVSCLSSCVVRWNPRLHPIWNPRLPDAVFRVLCMLAGCWKPCRKRVADSDVASSTRKGPRTPACAR